MTFATMAVPKVRLRPVQALVVHEADRDGYLPGSPTSLITAHPVLAGPQGPTLGPGTVMSGEDQGHLRDILDNNLRGSSSYLPANVLAIGAREIAWFVPGAVREMIWRTGDVLKRLRVPWPSLVLMASEGSLSVVAVKDARRPAANAAVYHVPLGNFYADTRMCSGDVAMPTTYGTGDTGAWEQTLFASAFTHVNHNHTLQSASRRKTAKTRASVDTGALLAFWRGLATRRTRRFPVEALARLSNMTLEKWLSRNVP